MAGGEWLFGIFRTSPVTSLRAGVDVKVVAGRLGHSSTSVTQNVYQHRVEQLDRAAAEKVAGMLFGARKKRSAD